MRTWLVDVPVRINIWIRPTLQKKQWEIIKEARPRILFIQSDGGRNEEEWASIKLNRELVDNGIDWECKVYKFYESKNLGLYTMGTKVEKFIWDHVDRCVFLEDDHIPSASYFLFCADLLDRYKNDQRIEAICPFNVLGEWKRCKADYFFSRRGGSVWGYATWRDRAVNVPEIRKYKNDKYFMTTLKQLERVDYLSYKRIIGYTKNPYYENHIPFTEFWHRFNAFAQNRLFIVASKSLLTCEGATDNSAHSCDYDKLTGNIKSLFFSRRYEIEMPLCHPEFVINDESFAAECELLFDEKFIKKTRRYYLRIREAIAEKRLFRTVYRKLFGKTNNNNNNIEK